MIHRDLEANRIQQEADLLGTKSVRRFKSLEGCSVRHTQSAVKSMKATGGRQNGSARSLRTGSRRLGLVHMLTVSVLSVCSLAAIVQAQSIGKSLPPRELVQFEPTTCNI